MNNPNAMKMWAALAGIDLESAYAGEPKQLTDDERIKLMREALKDDTTPKIVIDSTPNFLFDADYGQIEEHVLAQMGGRGSAKGLWPDHFIFDEAQYIRSWDIGYDPDLENRDGPKGEYWTQPIPVKGPETPPDAKKRAKLRAKRKKRK